MLGKPQARKPLLNLQPCEIHTATVYLFAFIVDVAFAYTKAFSFQPTQGRKKKSFLFLEREHGPLPHPLVADTARGGARLVP